MKITQITSTDHNNRVCTLTHNGKPVAVNEVLEDSGAIITG
jgi:hypothetical protein